MAGIQPPSLNKPPKDYGIEVARGNIPGVSILSKFGRNTDIDTGTTPEDIWDGGGIWVPPTTTRTHQITSSSTNDTSAGTGAQTIRVLGLDSSFNEQQEDITMNGTSNVATASTYTMIYRMFVLSAGSGGENAGNITATADTDSTVTAQINAGNSQTLMAIYQIPNAKTGYIRYGYLSGNSGGGAGARADGALLLKPNGGVYLIAQVVGISETGTSAFLRDFSYAPAVAPAKSIIKAQVTSVSANNSDISAAFDIILIDD